MADRLTPQRPPTAWPSVGSQHVGEPVLLILRRSQVPFWSRLQQFVVGWIALGREATICRDRGRKVAKFGRQPAPRLGIIHRVVVPGQPGAVSQRPGEAADHGGLMLQCLQAWRRLTGL